MDNPAIKDLIGITENNFRSAVAMGMVPGFSFVDKFGYNPEIATATDPEDIWETGGIYSYSTTADIVSLSSSEAADTQKIKITGLTLDGTLTVQEATLTGQTVVSLDTPLWRVFRMENEDTTDLSGTVYCFSGTAVTSGVPSGASVTKASINNGNNQTLMALYTIPTEKVGFLYRAEVGLQYSSGFFAAAAYARGCFKSRRYGKVFKIKKLASCASGGNSNYKDDRVFPDPLPALTDIALSVLEVSATLGVWGTFEIMLVDADKLTDEYLELIGQPSI